jgi:hypothetical protein
MAKSIYGTIKDVKEQDKKDLEAMGKKKKKSFKDEMIERAKEISGNRNKKKFF